MADRTIPQRELRNNIGAVLRAAEADETFMVTVRGRPVARVVPALDIGEPRADVDRATVRRILAPCRGSWPISSISAVRRLRSSQLIEYLIG
jgi:prevent-host-death family protein